MLFNFVIKPEEGNIDELTIITIEGETRLDAIGEFILNDNIEDMYVFSLIEDSTLWSHRFKNGVNLYLQIENDTGFRFSEISSNTIDNDEYLAFLGDNLFKITSLIDEIDDHIGCFRIIEVNVANRSKSVDTDC